MHGGLLVCIYLTNKSNQLHSMQVYPHIPAIFANTYQDSLFGFLYAQSLLTISQCLLNPQRTSPGDVWLWQAPGVTIASSRSCLGAVRNQLTYHPRSYTSDWFLSWKTPYIFEDDQIYNIVSVLPMSKCTGLSARN